LYDGTAAIISVPLFVWLGFIFAENLEHLHKIIKTPKHGILIIIVAAVVIVGLFLLVKRIKKKLAI
jgi:membrane protein DedA with SNARE-associated domain